MKVLTKEKAMMYHSVIKDASSAMFDNLIYVTLSDGELDEEAVEKFATSAVRSALYTHVLLSEMPSELVERVMDAEKQRLLEMVAE